jgi:hypothetical protein
MNGTSFTVPDWVIVVVVVFWFVTIGGAFFVLCWWLWDFIKTWFGK